MITYEDFKNCAALVREAADRMERVDRLRSIAERCTVSVYSDNSKTHTTRVDKIGDLVVRIEEATAQCKRFAEMVAEHVLIVDMEICAIPDSTQRTILRMRYIDGLTWPEMSEKMNKSESWLYKQHKKGLEILGIVEGDD